MAVGGGGAGNSEETVLAVKAQVYILDPATSNWAPGSTSVISINLLYNPSNGSTRAVGMENGEVRLNTMITPGLTFQKSSDTFGQWVDGVGQLYGLNFASPSDAEQFASNFKLASEGKRPGPAPAAAAPAPKPAVVAAATTTAASTVSRNVSTGALASQAGADPAELEALKRQVADLSQKLSQKDGELAQKGQELSQKQQEVSHLSSERDNLAAQAAKVDSLNAQIKSLQAQTEQQKAEIARLGASAGLESQLKALQEENAKLRQALLQNHANAMQWKDQLAELEQESRGSLDKLRKLRDLQAQFAAIAL